ncbi:MAG: hypothetical protein PWP04_1624 [Candidatus Atribacteria bacterium]|nr:hypothetical protein [Candidatus Atribacteria bacterium]
MVRKYGVRSFVLAGVLGAVSIMLSLTPIGMIPVPNLAGYATTVHIPAIVGGIIGGPLVGAMVGLILAFSTMHLFLGNLVACFVPRLLIGVVSYLVWDKLGRKDWAVVAASLAGTATNTVGVLGFMVLFRFFTWEQVIPIFALNGVLELIISGIIVWPIIKIIQRVVKWG